MNILKRAIRYGVVYSADTKHSLGDDSDRVTIGFCIREVRSSFDYVKPAPKVRTLL